MNHLPSTATLLQIATISMKFSNLPCLFFLLGMGSSLGIVLYFLFFSTPVDSQSQLSSILRLSPAPLDRNTEDKSWTENSIRQLWIEREKMAHTPMFRWNYPGQPNVDLMFKNESATESGSLKHRYAWALMMWALMEGHVLQNTTVFEASSGNTAASLGFMCEKIGVPFTAIVPDTIEQVKQEHIEQYGGSVIKVPIAQRLDRAREEADRNGGFFMNQFGNADRAEEYHESGNYKLESANTMHEILQQLKADDIQIVKTPHFFVHSAGTGGTISSIGKYVKKYGVNTKVVLADTQFSVYADVVLHGLFKNESGANLWVEPGMAGTGYGPMGAVRKGETSSLDGAVIDRVVKVPDMASTAAMKVLRDQGIEGGTSTGINFVAVLHVAATTTLPDPSTKLTIVTLLADPASYYETSYYNRDWIAKNFAPHGGLQAYDCWISVIYESLQSGADPLELGVTQCGVGNFDTLNRSTNFL